MKTPRNILAIFFFLVCTLLVSAQEKDKETDQERVEKNTKPFSLDYFSNPENTFYVISLAVENSQVVVNQESKITEVKGKIPYPSGDLNVRVLDAQDKQIANYFMQNPLILRSCEDENQSTTIIGKGVIQVILPKSTAIAKIELISEQHGKQTIDIRPVMERFLKGDNDD